MRKLTFAVALALAPVSALAAAPSAPAPATALPAEPEGETVKVRFSQATVPAGQSLPGWSPAAARYIYVVSGRLQVSNLVTGAAHEVGPGEMTAEADWSEGRALGAEPASVLVIEQAE